MQVFSLFFFLFFSCAVRPRRSVARPPCRSLFPAPCGPASPRERGSDGRAQRRDGKGGKWKGQRWRGETGGRRRNGKRAGRDGKGGRAGGTGQKPAGGVPGARADETDGRRGVTEKGEMEKSSGDRHGSGRYRKSRRGSRRAGHAGGRWRAAGEDTRGAGRRRPPGSCAGWKAATGRGRSCAGTRRTTRPTGGCPRWR